MGLPGTSLLPESTKKASVVKNANLRSAPVPPLFLWPVCPDPQTRPPPTRCPASDNLLLPSSWGRGLSPTIFAPPQPSSSTLPFQPRGHGLFWFFFVMGKEGIPCKRQEMLHAICRILRKKSDGRFGYAPPNPAPLAELKPLAAPHITAQACTDFRQQQQSPPAPLPPRTPIYSS